MTGFNEISLLAKGIYYNKKTKLCIFEINQGELKWFNVHVDNIKGKFYRGCPAKLYQDNEILKAVIIEPDDKKENKKK